MDTNSNSNKITAGSIYDVSTYSDRDLYNILDLDDPSDRELEAKILAMVNKYTRMKGNLSSDMLAQFFIDIYTRFFDIPDDESEYDTENETPERYDSDTETEYEGFTADYGNLMVQKVNGLNIAPEYNVMGQQPDQTYIRQNGNKWSNYENNEINDTTNEIQKGKIYGNPTNDKDINMTRNYNFVNFAGNVDTTDACGNALRNSKIKEQPRITQTYNTQKVNRVGTLDNTKNDRGDNPTQLTKPIDYTNDYINPLLKQTIKRVISIDSQYRDNKKSSSTEFTFNLSEPLKDVVSLKLYSVQIPYTWYTINSSFGGNFFYIKGDAEGIDNGNHDYKIEIASGNYTASTLVDAIQTSISNLRESTPHVEFGKTSISYASSNVLTSLNIDIKEAFGESNYYLEFPNWSSPLDSINRANTLAGYLGYNTTKYDCFSIYSDRTILPIQLQSEVLASSSFLIDDLNNKITIVNYISNTNSYEYQPIPTTQIHDSSYSIDIPNGIYNIYTLMEEINTQIASNDAFDHEYSKIQSINIDGLSNAQNAGFSYIKLDIKFKRKIIRNKENLKTAIIFPSTSSSIDFNVWTDSLKFSKQIYESSYIQSETQITQSRYVIQNGVYGKTGIKFKCDVSGYIDTTNDIVIDLSNSSVLGYTLDEYISEINRAIRAYKDPFGNKTITDTIFEKTPDHFIKITPVVNVSFTNKDYKIKVEGRNLPKLLCNIVKDPSNSSVTEYTSNLSQTHEWLVDFSREYTTIIDNTDKISIIPLFPYGAHNSGYIPQTFTIELYTNTTPPSYTFTSVREIVAYMNNAFFNYMDNEGVNPFITGNPYTYLTQNDDYSYTFSVGINKAFKTENYLLSLYGAQNVILTNRNSPIINPWVTYLDFIGNYNNPDLPNEQIYNLKNTNPDNAHIILNNSPRTSNQITLTHDNNYFYIKSYSTIDGLTKNGSGLYDIKITIPVENDSQVYAIDDIYAITNSLFENSFNGIAKGSIVSKDSNGHTVFKMNINKVFRTDDYRLVFYDPYSFVSCYSGATRRGSQSVQNATWDTTVGWVLGFREQIIYYLREQTLSSTANGNPVYTLLGDTTVSTSLYNYFLIVLDDYTQNHLNDGLVTITTQETSIDVGPYKYVCDPYSANGSNIQIAVPADKDYTKMSQREIYTFNQKILSKKVKEKSYSKGPFVKDIFGIIPIKTSGLQPGSTYVEFGGTLQNQERMYFGPVNIHRMTIRLLNDRGDLVDLNNANWSFSLVCEQLYKKTTL